MPRTTTEAFTLVEIAIVLVILGLLVGGVMVGQDLIRSAGVRSTLTQIQSFNTATTAFRTRFGALPGDIRANRASIFSLPARAGTTGRGDGNGILENGTTAGALQGLGYETAMYWRDLSEADMIGNPFTTGTDAPAASIAGNAIGLYVPSSKLNADTFLHVYAVGGRNYYYLGGITSSAPTDANGVLSVASTISPVDSQSMDEKRDDGRGNTGSMFAVNSIVSNSFLTGTGISTSCLNTDGTYNSDGTDGSTPNCRLAMRTSF